MWKQRKRLLRQRKAMNGTRKCSCLPSDHMHTHSLHSQEGQVWSHGSIAPCKLITQALLALRRLRLKRASCVVTVHLQQRLMPLVWQFPLQASPASAGCAAPQYPPSQPRCALPAAKATCQHSCAWRCLQKGWNVTRGTIPNLLRPKPTHLQQQLVSLLSLPSNLHWKVCTIENF